MESRQISVGLGQLYLRECKYSLPPNEGQTQRRRFYGLGFQNDKGGYELRNEFLPQSSHPKAITTINANCEEVAVFEGFFDMLSALMYSGKTEPVCSMIVLNSLSMLNEAMPALMRYKRVHLFLDNDPPGQTAAAMINEQHPYVTNQSAKIYPDCKDFNDFLLGKRLNS